MNGICKNVLPLLVHIMLITIYLLKRNFSRELLGTLTFFFFKPAIGKFLRDGSFPECKVTKKFSTAGDNELARVYILIVPFEAALVIVCYPVIFNIENASRHSSVATPFWLGPLL